jgi:hypothetical protein
MNIHSREQDTVLKKNIMRVATRLIYPKREQRRSQFGLCIGSLYDYTRDSFHPGEGYKVKETLRAGR